MQPHPTAFRTSHSKIYRKHSDQQQADMADTVAVTKNKVWETLSIPNGKKGENSKINISINQTSCFNSQVTVNKTSNVTDFLNHVMC